MLHLLKPTDLESTLCNNRSHRNEQPEHHNQRKRVHNKDPAQPEINIKKNKFPGFKETETRWPLLDEASMVD